MMDQTKTFAEEELAELVSGFEQWVLPLDNWNHRSKLAVAMWYVLEDDADVAEDRLRRRLQSFNIATGLGQGKYHETITMFWFELARRFAARRPAQEATLDTTNGFVVCYGARAAVQFKHYSREKLFSTQARRERVEPDLLSLTLSEPGVAGARGTLVGP